jgi:uncharacterized membrane protein (DUF106 family)
VLIPFQPLPFEEVLLITLGISLIIAFVYRGLTKPEEMRKVKKDMGHYKEEAKKAQKAGDREKMNQFMNEQLKASHRMFSLNMKPMLLSMLFFFILLGWLAGQYAELVVLAPFSIPFIGPELNWFWWYIVITLPATMLFRRLLGVE